MVGSAQVSHAADKGNVVRDGNDRDARRCALGALEGSAKEVGKEKHRSRAALADAGGRLDGGCAFRRADDDQVSRRAVLPARKRQQLRRKLLACL